jgi:hypothetical protein
MSLGRVLCVRGSSTQQNTDTEATQDVTATAVNHKHTELVACLFKKFPTLEPSDEAIGGLMLISTRVGRLNIFNGYIC